MEFCWEKDGKRYHFSEYPQSQQVRISVVDDIGYPCHEQVTIPIAIWNAMAYLWVAADRKQEAKHGRA